MDRFIAISGCSGGGKSTLLRELGRRGHATVEEPGRRIIAEELRGAGGALPWVDLRAFAQRAVAVALGDHADAASLPGWVFFDRGLIDALAALAHATGTPIAQESAELRYNRRVFFTPPWPEIYQTDTDRRHPFDEAVSEYARLVAAYAASGHAVEVLPRTSVEARADLILARLEAG